MSVKIDATIICDGCGTRTLDEGDKIYCEDCYDRMQDTMEDLYAEVEGLEQEVLELTQEIEELERQFRSNIVNTKLRRTNV